MLSNYKIAQLVKWELKKDFYKNLIKRRKTMATINFSEEDLLNEEKKKKKEQESNTQKIKNKVQENWDKIFNSNADNVSTKNENSKTTTVENVQPVKTASENKETKNNSNTSLVKQDNAKNTQVSAQNANLQSVNANSNKQAENEQKSSEQKTNEQAKENLQANNTSNNEQSTYENLLEKINEITNKYDVEPQKGQELNTDLNLTKKEYVTKTDEELKNEAESALRDYKNAELESINSKIDNSLSALDGKEESLKSDADEQKAQLKAYYDNAKSEAANDALKRGLQRSSIVINNLNAFDNDKIAKLMEIDSQLNAEIDSLNEQIASLNTEREQAINDFNIEYALKVNEKIAELEQEIQDRNDEITEYNNKIAQIEAEYKQSSTESNNEMDNDYLDNLIDYAENKGTILSMRDSAYAQVIDEYLNSLSKEDALSELQNNAYIKELLGTNYAYYLYKTQNRK